MEVNFTKVDKGAFFQFCGQCALAADALFCSGSTVLAVAPEDGFSPRGQWRRQQSTWKQVNITLSWCFLVELEDFCVAPARRAES